MVSLWSIYQSDLTTCSYQLPVGQPTKEWFLCVNTRPPSLIDCPPRLCNDIFTANDVRSHDVNKWRCIVRVQWFRMESINQSWRHVTWYKKFEHLMLHGAQIVFGGLLVCRTSCSLQMHWRTAKSSLECVYIYSEKSFETIATKLFIIVWCYDPKDTLPL